MKIQISTKNSILWGVIALIIGLIIAFNPSSAAKFSIQLCGLLLLIIGTTNLISFLVLKHRNNLEWSQISYGSILAFLIGLILMLSPETFMKFWGYLVGTMIAALGVMQIISRRNLKKIGAPIQFKHYLFPILIIAMGIVVMLFPIEPYTWIMVFAGLCISAFGVAEILTYFTLAVPARAEMKLKQQQEKDNK